jgi:Flp pilus assembly protein TadB
MLLLLSVLLLILWERARPRSLLLMLLLLSVLLLILWERARLRSFAAAAAAVAVALGVAVDFVGAGSPAIFALALCAHRTESEFSDSKISRLKLHAVSVSNMLHA